MYAPHPQKIVGLKFCWVVLTSPKRFFVKKKNIGRVNPGRGGVDDPLPKKIVGLKLCWVVVSIAGRVCITNFRPIGPFFLVELEFLVGGWWWVVKSDIRVKPNQVKVRLWLSCG